MILCIEDTNSSNIYVPKKHLSKLVTVIIWDKDMVLDDQIADSIKLDEINIKDHYTQSTMDIFLSCETSYWIDTNVSQLSENYNFETRHPFLDIRLIEYSLQIPPEYLYRCAKYKGLLREVMKNRLPQEILQRNDKGDATENTMDKVKAMNMEYLYDCPRLVESNLLDAKDAKVLKSVFINMDKKVLEKSCAKGKVLYYAACLNLENWIKGKIMEQRLQKKQYKSPIINNYGDMKEVTKGLKNHTGSDGSNNCYRLSEGFGNPNQKSGCN